mmetsp:Transcript_45478/g.54717  ORF Transcript_45478/g.54717 Transcript_45478/m.54717 type:complete len:80 (+) Transcript_45478:141-380(+)
MHTAKREITPLPKKIVSKIKDRKQNRPSQFISAEPQQRLVSRSILTFAVPRPSSNSPTISNTPRPVSQTPTAVSQTHHP